MRRVILLSILSLIMLLALSFRANAITIDPAVRFVPSDISMVGYFNTTSTLNRIRLTNDTLFINGAGVTANGTQTVNVTIRTWPLSLHGSSRIFIFDVNTTTGTAIQFSLSLESSSQYFDDWTVWINGTQVAFSGTVAPIQFSHSDWESGVSKTVLIETDILQIEPLGPRAEWLATYGPAWLALFVAVGFIGLIIASFYRGVKKRKGKGKVWKFMPRKFR